MSAKSRDWTSTDRVKALTFGEIGTLFIDGCTSPSSEFVAFDPSTPTDQHNSDPSDLDELLIAPATGGPAMRSSTVRPLHGDRQCATAESNRANLPADRDRQVVHVNTIAEGSASTFHVKRRCRNAVELDDLHRESSRGAVSGPRLQDLGRIRLRLSHGAA